MAHTLELLFDQIKRTQCDHHQDCARDGFQLSNQPPLVTFWTFVKGIEDEENLGVCPDL